jgi:hypothetical protein
VVIVVLVPACNAYRYKVAHPRAWRSTCEPSVVRSSSAARLRSETRGERARRRRAAGCTGTAPAERRAEVSRNGRPVRVTSGRRSCRRRPPGETRGPRAHRDMCIPDRPRFSIGRPPPGPAQLDADPPCPSGSADARGEGTRARAGSSPDHSPLSHPLPTAAPCRQSRHRPVMHGPGFPQGSCSVPSA